MDEKDRWRQKAKEKERKTKKDIERKRLEKRDKEIGGGGAKGNKSEIYRKEDIERQ